MRTEKVRHWQRNRTREWRQRWYKLGYTYKKIDGHWGWISKSTWAKTKQQNRKPRPVRARIHSNNPAEIERIQRKNNEEIVAVS